MALHHEPRILHSGRWRKKINTIRILYKAVCPAPTAANDNIPYLSVNNRDLRIIICPDLIRHDKARSPPPPPPPPPDPLAHRVIDIICRATPRPIFVGLFRLAGHSIVFIDRKRRTRTTLCRRTDILDRNARAAKTPPRK